MTSKLDSIKNEIEKSLQIFHDHPDNISPFRSIEYLLESHLINDERLPFHEELFSIYLLTVHLLNLLTGDVRYHQDSKELCCQIFSSLADLLQTIPDLILEKDNSLTRYRDKYKHCINIYLTNVKKINQLISDTK